MKSDIKLKLFNNVMVFRIWSSFFVVLGYIIYLILFSESFFNTLSCMPPADENKFNTADSYKDQNGISHSNKGIDLIKNPTENSGSGPNNGRGLLKNL